MIHGSEIFGEQPDPLGSARTAEEIRKKLGEETRRPNGSARDDESTPSDTDSPAWPELSRVALYGLAGDVVCTIGPYTEADPAAILFQFLAAAANVIGPRPHTIADGARHPLIIDPLLVGETSKARKGTSWAHIRRLFAQVDPGWAKERLTTGLSSSEGLIKEIRDDADPVPDRRLLIVQSEFASVLRVMERTGNTLSSTMRAAWDGDDLRTLVTHNPLKATGAHVGLIAHITRFELLRHLSDTEQHNGFTNRLLFVCVKRSKCLPEGGSVPQAELDDLLRRMREVIKWVKPKGDLQIKRDETARRLWAEVYPKLSAGRPGLLGAATSRGEAQVLRLESLLAILDCSQVAQVEHLKAALACWDYAFGSAKLIFGDAVGDPVADRILDALTNAGADGLTRTQIRDLFQKNLSADRITSALHQLVALGRATFEKIPTDGRSSELWRTTETIKTTEG